MLDQEGPAEPDATDNDENIELEAEPRGELDEGNEGPAEPDVEDNNIIKLEPHFEKVSISKLQKKLQHADNSIC